MGSFELAIDKIGIGTVFGFSIGSFYGFVQSFKYTVGKPDNVLMEFVAANSFKYGIYYATGGFLYLFNGTLLREMRGTDDILNYAISGGIAGAAVSFYHETDLSTIDFRANASENGPTTASKEIQTAVRRSARTSAPILFQNVFRTSLICGTLGALYYSYEKLIISMKDWDKDQSVLDNLMKKRSKSD